MIKDGELDIIVGTHSLLGDRVVYSNLGLLVVDEEQVSPLLPFCRQLIICFFKFCISICIYNIDIELVKIKRFVLGARYHSRSPASHAYYFD